LIRGYTFAQRELVSRGGRSLIGFSERFSFIYLFSRRRASFRSGLCAKIRCRTFSRLRYFRAETHFRSVHCYPARRTEHIGNLKGSSKRKFRRDWPVCHLLTVFRGPYLADSLYRRAGRVRGISYRRATGNAGIASTRRLTSQLESAFTKTGLCLAPIFNIEINCDAIIKEMHIFMRTARPSR
jgi:hypothetical protein